MMQRRDFLARSLQASTLLSLGSTVPEFVASTARAADKAEKKKDTVLVLVELAGGNDGLNTVIPYADDEYHKARPTLAFKKKDVVQVNDELGLHPSMRVFENLMGNGQLAIVQGVGYPNPNRSHFESMDIWHKADPTNQLESGWINRSVPGLQSGDNIPVMQLGNGRLPKILDGANSGVISLDPDKEYSHRLNLSTNNQKEEKARRKLLDDLTTPKKGEDTGDLLSFVQRRQVETYTTLDRLREFLDKRKNGGERRFFGGGSLPGQLQLAAELIDVGIGARVLYTQLGGFDTHSGQSDNHSRLLGQVANAISSMFQTLKRTGNADRVIAMTYSEFGRRVNENGSRGTDHGSGSCLFLAGPSVKGGVVGKHPSLKTLLRGDLQYHTDFRRVYATLLDGWLGVDSKGVLQAKFEPMELLRKKG